ncbi:unnamed protein product [Anisakis simplex]|uniref:MFS domain-containing protein n=1 Tax=Anisakis simplex TaxID=6269 RepID=A0A0M3JXL7_ANISI|nr:unnamed protein product [Anisakis simplex]
MQNIPQKTVLARGSDGAREYEKGGERDVESEERERFWERIINNSKMELTNNNDSNISVNKITANNKSASSISIKEAVNVGCLANRTRYFILILGSLCISLISSNMITFNFTKICMVFDNTTGDRLPLEYPLASLDGITYTQYENSALMWAVGVGTLLAAWPFQLAYEQFGARTVFLVAGVMSTVSTAVIPYLAQTTFNGFLAARFVQGWDLGEEAGQSCLWDRNNEKTLWAGHSAESQAPPTLKEILL